MRRLKQNKFYSNKKNNQIDTKRLRQNYPNKKKFQYNNKLNEVENDNFNKLQLNENKDLYEEKIIDQYKKEFNSVKRKRDSVSKKIPWLSVLSKESKGMIRFHNEISEFYEFIRPSSHENLMRIKTFNSFKKLIQSKWPRWEVKYFGSFPLNIHLPDSDIDMIVLKQNDYLMGQKGTIYNYLNDAILNENAQLNLIHNKLHSDKFCDDINMVDAKVPIIRAKCKETQIRMDIT
jgi:DNA polymerase sigma